MIEEELKRSPSYVMTVMKRDDPQVRKFEERLHRFNAKLKLIRKKYDLVPPPRSGNAPPVGFIPYTYVEAKGRLGKNNPANSLYSRALHHRHALSHRNIKSEHAQRFDIYLKPGMFFCGYAESDEPDIQPKFDNSKMLHCENGPSIRLEGFTFYHWHGIQVPAEIILGTYTLPEILNIPNSEHRRIVMERIGWAKLIDQFYSITIDEDPDPQIGTLIQIDNPLNIRIPEERPAQVIGDLRENWNTWQFLRVRCGTGREFAIRVPLHVRTALEAQAWIWNISVDVFQKPEVRT